MAAKTCVSELAWPHQRICPGTNRVAALPSCRGDRLPKADYPFAEIPGRWLSKPPTSTVSQVTVSSIHLKWPWPHRQPDQLTDMEKAFHEIRVAGRPVLIGGDMNAALGVLLSA